MHLLSTRPGGFVEDETVITRLDQTPADMVVLSSADTTLALLSAAARQQPGLPSLRLANLLYLRQPGSLDLYLDQVLQHARVIVVDHLGSVSTWPYGVQQIVALARQRGQVLAMFSGDLQEDPHLLAQGTMPAAECRQLWQYLRAGGAANAAEFLKAVAFFGMRHGNEPLPPRSLPQASIHVPMSLSRVDAALDAALDDVSAKASSDGRRTSSVVHDTPGIDDLRQTWHADALTVALVFYRSHLLAANTAAFDALAQALLDKGLNPLPIALDSLKDDLCLSVLRSLCAQHDVALVLNTTAFSALETGDALAGDAPVLQVITSGGNREDWWADSQGLRPRDIAMQVVLPEMDGRIVTRAISFKGLAHRCPVTQTDVVAYQAEPDRVDFVAELAWRWCRLRSLPNAEKKLALVLANYPGSEGRIGSGVGLDTPASMINILRRLSTQGYQLGPIEGLPGDGDALMRVLQQGIANDPEQWPLRPAWQSYALADYQRRLADLPEGMADAIQQRWGAPEADPSLRQGRFMIAGLRLGHVFVGIQPARALAQGGIQNYASYHDAELVPPHGYLAFYFWLRDVFAIDAVVHVGKHGNLEWLPGKSLALSSACWPDVILGPLPHLYPFIVNDPGEGAQAKRRTQAVIIDHLMPPLTRAENHGPMQDLERLVDEYYDALLVDARRATLLRRQILAAVRQQHLAEELHLGEGAQDDNSLLERIDAYLCELKETQIRDGLHVFGASPTGQQRRDTLMALARYPSGDGHGGSASLLTALAADLLAEEGAAFDPLRIIPTRVWNGPRPAALQSVSDDTWRHEGDTLERLELLARQVLDSPERALSWPHTAAVLTRVENELAPALDACGAQELHQLMRGLAGCFVPPGPSGSPSRGRPDVLPTGRNFYALDTRAIPTQAAWELGQAATRQLLERYLQEHGDYPRTLGLSVWGTATMRTGGDDIAQAFALIGVRPKWAPGSQRVLDFEVLPRVGMGRPRVDVTLRISGFFRDAFPLTVQMFDAAVQAVAALEEDAEDNPIRARILAEAQALEAAGLSAAEARRQAGWRVFGAPPGHYGTGLDPLMQSGGWEHDGDLARAYLGWSAHAYGQDAEGVPAGEALRRRLGELDVVAQNQDSREHDILDSGDYYQFQGGMAAAVRHISGRQPALLHGDHSNPMQPRVRSLKEEIGRVVRARVTNPKWIDGAKRHGYKGAFEMAATVDYLFGFDATTHAVSDHHYALVTNAYVLDDVTREFLQTHNPRALHGMLERLLEAMQRGLWEEPGDYRGQLEDLLLQQEDHLEGMP